MGRAKAKWMEDDENGFISGNGHYICATHFQENAINNFIELNKDNQRCSFCRARKATSLDEVLRFILNRIKIFYGDPNDGFGHWDDEEHAWSEEYPNTSELFFETIGLRTNPDSITDVIGKLLDDDKLWVEKDTYYDSDDDLLFYDWEFFKEVLKHKMRFVFYKTKVSRTIDYNKKEMVDPYLILEDIGKTIHKLNLFYKLVTGTKVFRARQHTDTERIRRGKNLGSAPRKDAKTNRFSPAGIPMFYGAAESDTARKEIINTKLPDELITSGEFVINQPMSLIDLTSLPVISIFDEEQENEFYPLLFLRRFVADITAAVETDGSEHIEYVPTQVITEYFRFVMTAAYELPINGIRYKSVKDPKKICYVLFLDENQCTQDDAEYDASQPLCLALNSLDTKKVSELAAIFKAERSEIIETFLNEWTRSLHKP